MADGTWFQVTDGTPLYDLFIFQKVDVSANTMAAVASESEQLVTAGLPICLQFDRVGVRGVEICSSKLPPPLCPPYQIANRFEALL